MNYANDEQWNVWVEEGFRKLVAVDSATTSMHKPADNYVEKSNCINSTSPSRGAYERLAEFVNNTNKTPRQATWGVEEDRELDLSGGDLIEEIGWDWSRVTNITTDSRVSAG